MANAKLKDELQLQSIGVDNLMQRFSQQAKHYQKMVRSFVSDVCLHRLAELNKIYLFHNRKLRMRSSSKRAISAFKRCRP